MSTTHAAQMGQQLLADMARIPVIIPGKLSERRDANGKVNGWKLQHWQDGRNQTRYIPAEQVERVREGTAGHQQFMAMAQDYVEAKGQEALSALNTPADSKKKPMKR
jgi:hypothetical protein